MKRALRVAVWTLGGFAGLLALAYGVALFLPVRHTASVSRVVAGTPEEVWAVITGVEEFTTWRTDIDRAERLEPRQGWPVWREEGASGSLTFEVTGIEPGRRLVTRIADEGLPFGGTWTYELEPTGTGTVVTITENGEIYSPVYRFVSRFFLGYEGTLTTYLEALEARMER
jgi:uncharacterized protein YndB with AHSA1/START domain